MSKKQTYFSDTWLTDLQFSVWVTKSTDSKKAYCKLCKKPFSLSNMGVKALRSHAKSENHLKRIKEKESVQNFFNKKLTSEPQQTNNQTITNETQQPLCEPHQDPSCEPPVLPKKVSMQQTLTASVLDSSSLKAEIVWALKSVMSGYSNNSSSDMNVTFQIMFPDSNIAKQYQMGPDKLKYIVNWGLAPYFKDLLIEDISKAKYLSVGFDESLNKITQSCPMDLMVRYWDVNNSKVQVRYWDSTFLGHSAANDLLQHFNDSVESIIQSKIIHVSMDGPAVNHKFYKGLEDYREGKNFPR